MRDKKTKRKLNIKKKVPFREKKERADQKTTQGSRRPCLLQPGSGDVTPREASPRG